ncbi:hypothetical protein B9Z19DRAFT_1082550 [Tuber borchii]|uniref:Uncharacterized protein n=1 Tax=Tuber borchii TaxID=42251 RepID=A0A2T6ZUI9_TUBBO|nr:hypothetical protein B9Z19DRAFT_1082550 [Tuber borchii]
MTTLKSHHETKRNNQLPNDHQPRSQNPILHPSKHANSRSNSKPPHRDQIPE